MKNIEINEQFKAALRLMENSSKNVFITGKAGTGKSTLLEYFRDTTPKKIVVLAPTGVAALNVAGETIHSFFRFKPDITPEKVKKIRGKRAAVYKELDAVVIDEISMVRADLLDCVDKFLRLNGRHKEIAFGGIQMLFIGDLYQLPPVVTAKEKRLFEVHYQSPYFFSSRVFENLALEFLELEKIYRQSEESFIGLLNAIRNNTVTDGHLSELNRRVGASFGKKAGRGFAVHLTTTNRAAEAINEERLSGLKRKIISCEAGISGDFGRNVYPTESRLKIAVGAQVMLLNNEQHGRWVNGTLGRVVDIEEQSEDEDKITVELDCGRREKVSPFTWEIFHFTYNDDTGVIDSEILGSFTQYPLRLAWAITIHKSQGKTFDRVTVDPGPVSFAGGQTYVALSRCTSFEGISLARPVKKHHVFIDRRIVDFQTRFQYQLSERDLPFAEKLKIIERAIRDKEHLQITYLKNSDVKTRRCIRPYEVGEMEYEGKPFTGVSGYCLTRKQDRVFRVDRILEMKAVGAVQ